MQEIWRDIDGYEGLYQISNLGRVKSLERIINRIGRWGKPAPYIKKEAILNNVNVHGYLYVSLCKEGQKNIRYAIHRLVAQAFLPNPNNLPQVNHKDEDKTNNNVLNLEWCDIQYNHSYGNRAIKQSASLKNSGKVKRGKNGNAKKVICDGVIYDCIADFADEYNITPNSIYGYLGGCKPMPARWRAMGLSYYRKEAC